MAVLDRRCRGFFTLVFLLTLFLSYPIPAVVRAAVPPPGAPEDFPIYPEIRPNVNFWIAVFTRYDKDQGIIHDSRDLSRIYGTIPLDPSRTRTADKKNRKIKKKALADWKKALLDTARGKALSDPQKAKKIRKLFGKTPKPKTLEQAAHSLRIQIGLRRQFKEGIVRSGAMVPEFKKIFRSHGLPEDLVYLPCVESSFNVKAYSKFGAAGVWQFTRGTGKRFMEIGYVVDERRDPFIASIAAARLLKGNHEELKEWSLAVTAYNHGLNGMKRAKKRHGSYPDIYRHYRSRAFQFASKNFYAEFLAARHVAKNYKTYFGDIRLDRPTPHTKITARGFLPAPEAARALGLDLEKIREMNPALRPPVFDGRKYIPKDFDLRLPPTLSASAAQKALAGLYKDKQKPSKFHRVQKGETAGRIARIHKVSLRELILANGLNRRATIFIGQTLRIPSKEEVLVAKAKAKPSEPSAPKKQEAQLRPPEKSDNTPPPKAEAKTKARQPDQDQPSATAAAEPAPEVPAVPEPSDAASDLPDSPEASDAPATPEDPALLKVVTADLKIVRVSTKKGKITGIIHVAPMETLGHYADWLSIPTREIRHLNRMPFGKPISVGQQIKIPLPAGTSTGFEEKRYEFHQEILEDFFNAYFISGTDTYEVKSGDTLWDLCINELELPLWLLEKYNPGLDRCALRLGQKLTYPLVSPNGIRE